MVQDGRVISNLPIVSEFTKRQIDKSGITEPNFVKQINITQLFGVCSVALQTSRNQLDMFRAVVNKKIAQALVFFAENTISELYLTKALKLLYILDEISIRECGVPVTWLDYKVWKLGPVAENIYEELRHGITENCKGSYVDLTNAIQVNTIPNPVEDGNEAFVIVPKVAFNEDEFSDYELELLRRVAENYGHLSSKKLVQKLHETGTLWDKMVRSKKLKRQFELQKNRSNYIIDFTELVKDKYHQEMAYKTAFDSMSFQEGLYH